jgi:acetyl-CoA acetyltransferase
LVLDADEGVSEYSAESLAKLKPTLPGGVVTPGTQTHPADGSAGTVVTNLENVIYGHPQAPTGLRALVELVHALRLQGGGVGLFTGCAAGDMGAALVLRVN